MLDLDLIVTNKDEIIKRLETRNADFSYLEDLVKDAKKRKDLIIKSDSLKNKRNILSSEIGFKKSKGEDIKPILDELLKIKEEIISLDQKLVKLEKKVRETLLNTPNLPDLDVPVGVDENDNKVVKVVGKIKEFNFKVKDHSDLAEELDIIDFKRAAKVSGPRFVFYKGLGARLERALINFMMDFHAQKGYEEVLPPYLVNDQSMFGSGQFPKFIGDSFKIEGLNYYLNPTAEVPMINLYRDEILKKEDLPKSFVAYSTAFRQEAGSAGRDTKGIIRQHQFNKVELIKFVEPKNSEKELNNMLLESSAILKALKLPFRVVKLSTGDLGFSMAKTYDLEVWLPAQNKYREIASISNARDYQARRSQIRYKENINEKTKFVHTLNGSGLAVGRCFVAILENYQQKDGSLKVPDVLIPYMQGIKKITKKEVK